MESTRPSLLYQSWLLVQAKLKLFVTRNTTFKALVCLLYKTSMSWSFEDLIHWSRISFIIFHVWGVAVTKTTEQSRKIQNLILFAWNFFLWLWGIIYSWLIIENLLVLHNYRIYTPSTIMCSVSVFYFTIYIRLCSTYFWTTELLNRIAVRCRMSITK